MNQEKPSGQVCIVSSSSFRDRERRLYFSGSSTIIFPFKLAKERQIHIHAIDRPPPQTEPKPKKMKMKIEVFSDYIINFAMFMRPLIVSDMLLLLDFGVLPPKMLFGRRMPTMASNFCKTPLVRSGITTRMRTFTGLRRA